MKIAIVTSHHDPASGGGHTFESSILHALEHCQSSHHFLVFDLQGKLLSEIPSAAPAFESAGSSVPPFASLFPAAEGLEVRPLASPLASRALVDSRAATHAPDQLSLDAVMDFHRVDYLWFVSPSCIETRLPFAITVWDLEHRRQPFFPEVSFSGWTWEEREGFYSSYLPRAAAVIVGTAVGRRQVLDFYGVNPDHIIVNAFPVPPSLSPLARESLHLSDSSVALIRGLEDQRYLLYPAQFWPHKNHANLLLALSILRDVHGITLPLVLTGADKGNLAYVRSLAVGLQLESSVRFLGFVEAEDLWRLYVHAAALVFPSFFGPDNLPPLEAFALGCPVLASDGEGPREQLGDSAIYFDPANPVEIADRIRSVLVDDCLRLDLIRKGLSRCKPLTADAYVARMLQHFDRFEAIRFTWPAGYVHS